jgi:hypothetical protein
MSGGIRNFILIKIALIRAKNKKALRARGQTRGAGCSARFRRAL